MASRSKEPEFVFRAQLVDDFGLTPTILKELGEPDRIESRYNGPGNVHLWKRRRVKRFVARPRIKAMIEAAANRRANAAAGINAAEQIRDCDLLAAIFAVNRAAKRHRDNASKQWSYGRKSAAARAAEHKRNLYELKDLGIIKAFQDGRIHPTKIHGCLCLYEGEGYSFHSTLKPVGCEVQVDANDSPIIVDAKPQGRKEPRQMDAIAMLKSLSDQIGLAAFDRFERLELPSKRVERQDGDFDDRDDEDEYDRECRQHW